MQQRFELGSSIEITRFSPENDIRNKRRSRSAMLPQQFKFSRKQPKPPVCQTHEQHQGQCREDSLDPFDVKLDQAEFFFDQTSQNNAGDEKSGNDKEYVYPNEPALNKLGEGVIPKDG